MSRKLVVLAAAFALVFSLAFMGDVSNASDKGPADMVLKTGNAKKPAIFNHAKHQETFACADCHHGQDADGKQTPYVDNMEVKKCATCHNPDNIKVADPEADKERAKLQDFKGVGHLNCKECHKEKGAPNKCTDCHPEEKK